MTTDNTPVILPVLPLKNTVLFPHLFVPLSAGRPTSVAAVEAALAGEDKSLVLVAQKDINVDQPGPDDLYTIGTRAVIKKMARSENGVEMIVQGVVLVKMEQTEPFLKARVQPLPVADASGPELEALFRATLELGARAMKLAQPEAEVNIQQMAGQVQGPLHLAYLIGSMLSLD